MAVNQQHVAVAIGLRCKPGQVNFADMCQWHGADRGVGVIAVVDAAHMHIVHVQQQPAAGAPQHLGQKCSLVPGGSRKLDISGRVFQQHTPPQVRLHLVDVVAYPLQCVGVVRQRQQVVEKRVAVRRPRKML